MRFDLVEFQKRELLLGSEVMSYSGSNISYSDPQESATSAAPTGTTSNCCAKASAELKLYQTFIFSVPIFFTFVLLFLFYLFYLRRRRVDWASLRMRNSSSSLHTSESDDSSRAEMGLKKEVREMLPIIVFKESFSVKDTQCSVCLGDYQAEERLQQIPACGHTFHMDCIDNWLSTHATCPLCRQSLLVSSKASSEVSDVQIEIANRSSHAQNGGERSPGNGSSNGENSSQVYDGSCNRGERILTRHSEEEADAHDIDTDREMMRNNEREQC